MKKLNKKGFTLVELIVVIAIIGILAAVLVPSVTSYIGKAQKSSATQNAANKYQEYVLTLVDVCQKDVEDITVGNGWYWTDGTYVCLIVEGTVKVTEKTSATQSSKSIFKFFKFESSSYTELSGEETIEDDSALVEYRQYDSSGNQVGEAQVFYRLPKTVPATSKDATCSAPTLKSA